MTSNFSGKVHGSGKNGEIEFGLGGIGAKQSVKIFTEGVHSKKVPTAIPYSHHAAFVIFFFPACGGLLFGHNIRCWLARDAKKFYFARNHHQ